MDSTVSVFIQLLLDDPWSGLRYTDNFFVEKCVLFCNIRLLLFRWYESIFLLKDVFSANYPSQPGCEIHSLGICAQTFKCKNHIVTKHLHCDWNYFHRHAFSRQERGLMGESSWRNFGAGRSFTCSKKTEPLQCHQFLQPLSKNSSYNKNKIAWNACLSKTTLVEYQTYYTISRRKQIVGKIPHIVHITQDEASCASLLLNELLAT